MKCWLHNIAVLRARARATVGIAAWLALTVAHASDKSGVSPQAISLPSGPGSIDGLGPSFEPQLNSGTFSYNVPLDLPKCRGEALPAISIEYSSGNGNGILGLGWRLSVPRIQRRTDKGLPLYTNSDIIVDFTGEELVKTADGFFRSKNESGFVRYQFTNGYWLATLPNGVTNCFGQTTQTRLERNPGETFAWNLEWVQDPNGNRCEYKYIKSGNQLYLDEVTYGLHVTQASETLRVKCSYETNRPDPVIDYRGRFRSQTNWRLADITAFHGNRRIRYWRFAYVPGLRVSLLASVTVFGDDRSNLGAGAQVNHDFLPPLTLGYGSNSIATSYRLVTATNVPSLSFAAGEADLIDINHDGLPDILLNDQGVYYSILNQGERRPWAASHQITNTPPATFASPTTRLADLRGDGRSKLLFKDNNLSSFYYRDFLSPVGLGPDIDFFIPGSFPLDDPNVQMVDINGDKSIDLMASDGSTFDFLINRQASGGTNYVLNSPPPPPAPGILFSDGWQFADLNGDSLQDLVLIAGQDEGGTIFHYNKGWGEFDTREVMQGGPTTLGLRGRDAYHLADIDQDGLADLVMVDSGIVQIWFNTGTNAWSAPVNITNNVPDFDATTTAIRFADMNGNGSVDIVWNRADLGLNHVIQYLELNPLTKPYQLNRIDNGIGRVVQIEYRSSVDYMVDSLGTTQQWTSVVPFPVPVVSAFTVGDGLGATYRTEITYRNGYYDGIQKQFRGFEFAERKEIGNAAQGAPTLIADSGFDTGAAVEALKGKLLWSEQRADTGAVFSRITNAWTPRVLPIPLATGEVRQVTFAFLNRAATELLEGLPDAQAIFLQQDFDYDNFGNQILDANYGRIEPANLGAGNDERIVARTFTAAYPQAQQNWIIDSLVQEETRALSGTVISRRQNFYDDETFSGSNLGSVSRGNLTLTRDWISPADNTFISSVRTKYDPFGNPIWLIDPLAVATGGVVDTTKGHARSIDYDAQLHTFPIRETIHIGNGSQPLLAQADYDVGLGVVTNSSDFNLNQTQFAFDTFGRVTSIVRPGDSPAYPSAEYDYALAVPTGTNGMINYVETRVLDKTPGSAATKRDHYFLSRQFVDGLGRKRLSKHEAAPETDNGPPRVAIKDAAQFNARQKPSTILNPCYSTIGGTLDQQLAFENIEAPGWQGAFQLNGALVNLDLASAHKSSVSYDALLRETRFQNADATFRNWVYEPLLTRTFDENDTDPSSPFFGTPMTHYQDGLGRLVRVDEVARLNDDGTPSGNTNTWTTRYEYDVNDQLTRITDSQNNIKTFGYDGLKRKTDMNDPDRGMMHFYYDDASNLTRSTDAKGQQITYVYDGANRILGEDYHDEGLPISFNFAFNPSLPITRSNRPDVAYFYDTPQPNLSLGDGRIATASNTKGKLAYVWDLSGEEHASYDARGRIGYVVKIVNDPVNHLPVPYCTTFSYDSLDRVDILIFPDNDQVTHQFDDGTLLKRIIGGPSGTIISNLTYWPSDQQRQITYGNNVITSYAHDSRLRLKELSTLNSQLSTELVHFSYDFDGVSNIKSIADLRPGSVAPAGDPRRNTQLYQYDDLYRLKRAQYSFNPPGTVVRNDGEINYRYDRIGNMLSQTSTITNQENGLPVANLGTMDSGGPSGRWNRIGRAPSDPPGPHALSQISNPQSPIPLRTYPYDANGNMQNIDGLICTWDFKDRLIAVENDQMQATYTYDYTDLRILKSVVSKPGSTNQDSHITVTYVNKYFEVREHEAPTKYVWNGDTRVARITGSLTSNFRVQRLRLCPGWNLISLAVSSPAAALKSQISNLEYYRWSPSDMTWLTIADADTLPAGTVLWLKASTNANLSIIGTYSEPTNRIIPANGDFLPSAGLEAWNFKSSISNVPSAIASTYDSIDARWLSWLPPPLQEQSDLPNFIEPGNAAFARPVTPSQIEVPNPALCICYYHQDHLGSSAIETDSDGVVWEEMDFYPFGSTRNNFARDVPEAFGFSQKERDRESGLGYFEARFYHPTLNRFSRLDPLSAAIKPMWLATPQTLNLYTYSINNPIRYFDPDGRDPHDIFNGIGHGSVNFVGDTFNGIVAVFRDPTTLITAPIDALKTAGQAYFTSDGRARMAAQFSALNGEEKTALLTEAVLQGASAVLTEKLGGTVAKQLRTTERASAGAESAISALRLKNKLTGEEIASGHAFDKHVVAEGQFPSITTRHQFAEHIENIINNPSDMRQLSNGRTAYWDNSSGTLVIRNPKSIDGGTAFKPAQGKLKFEKLQ